MEHEERLNPREQLILQCVVQSHITTAEPVGSRTIVKRFGVDLSPATVRNVMADLEEAGYLEQVHTSSGRVPTDRGYRYYVNHLMGARTLSPDEQARIDRTMESYATDADADALIRSVGHVLALVSHHTGLVELPDDSSAEVRHIEVVPIGGLRIAVVIADNYGRVRTMVLSVDEPLSVEDIAPVNQFLDERVTGLPLWQLAAALETELLALWDERRRLAERALRWLQMVPAGRETTVVLEGATQLFEQPEFRDLAKAREIFELLEERSRLAALLQEAMAQPREQRVVVVIGSECHRMGMDDLSVVASPYSVGGRAAGVVGILGPRRMPYPRLSAIVDYTAESLSRRLTQLAQ